MFCLVVLKYGKKEFIVKGRKLDLGYKNIKDIKELEGIDQLINLKELVLNIN